MIEISNVWKSFYSTIIETRALIDVSVKFDRGSFTMLMGPSGCGKSTLLNITGLLDKVDKGTYKIDGTEILKKNEFEFAKKRRGLFGYIFQDFHLIQSLTAAENIEMPLKYLNTPKAKRKEYVSLALESLDLLERSNHYPRQLSGGQQQRVAIARAIACKPPLILADEPTGNLDKKNSTRVLKTLQDLSVTGTGVIMVTHAQEDAVYADRVIKMRDGQIYS